MMISTEGYFWFEKDVIGKGGYGEVFKGRSKKNGIYVAVKVSKKSCDIIHQRELELLKNIDSPYIVKYITSQLLSDGSGRIALITELAAGTVRDELNKVENYFGLPFRMLISLIAHLEQGLSYLHKNMIAHRDLKPANILVYYVRNNPIFKLCDFGGSRVVNDSTEELNTLCGTPGYLDANLVENFALRRKKLTYTKDECDLWSVGCTIFECATGILPFLPANGLQDAEGMHNMISCRPQDVIYGRVDGNGTLLWSKELPMNRCSYPKSFQCVLCEFIRHLFDRRELTCLTFEKFSKLAIELTSLKSLSVFYVNEMKFEEYFDTSQTDNFERRYIDQEICGSTSKDVLYCLLSLPMGLAISLPSSLIRKDLSMFSEIAVLKLRKDDKFYTMDINRKICVQRLPTRENLLNSAKEVKHAVAKIFRFEKEILHLSEFTRGLIVFCRNFWLTLFKPIECLMQEMKSTKFLCEAINLQSSLLGLAVQSNLEKAAVQNNVRLVTNELEMIEKRIEKMTSSVSDVRTSIESFDIVNTIAPAFSIDVLTGIMGNLARTKVTNDAFDKVKLVEADCSFVLHTLQNAIRIHREASEMTRKFVKEKVETVLRNMFDIVRNLYKTKQLLNESKQLVYITHETNKQRAEVLFQHPREAQKNNSSDGEEISLSECTPDSEGLLADFKTNLAKYRDKYVLSLNETEKLLEDLNIVCNAMNADSSILQETINENCNLITCE